MCDETESKSKRVITQYCSIVTFWKRLFCNMHCFMTSICDTNLNLMMVQTRGTNYPFIIKN